MAIVEITGDNFNEIMQGNDFVIIDFWAPWCAPCRNFAPVFEKAAERHSDIVFAKINTEEQQELAAQFQVRSIPTLMIFREQIILFSQAGSLQAPQLEQVLSKAKELDMDEVRRQIAEADKSA